MKKQATQTLKGYSPRPIDAGLTYDEAAHQKRLRNLKSEVHEAVRQSFGFDRIREEFVEAVRNNEHLAVGDTVEREKLAAKREKYL